MKKHLSRIFGEIEKGTGLEAQVFTLRKEPLFSSGNFSIDSASLDKVSKGSELLEKDGVTSFRFRYKGKSYICALKGEAKETKVTAYLLKKLLENEHENGLEDMTVDSFRLLFLGKLTKPQIQQLALAHPIQAKENYYCLILSSQPRQGAAVMDFLKTLCQPSDIICRVDEASVIFLKAWDDQSEYQSAADFAYMLNDSISEELGITPFVAIGGNCKGFETFLDAYQNAQNALRLGRVLDPANKVYYYKDYLLVKLYEELSKQEMERYLFLSSENMNRQIFEDEEIMYTAEQFLQNNLNISETARLLYLHRNTLIYRLDKLEKETGLNIRRFYDAMVFRTLRIISKLI